MKKFFRLFKIGNSRPEEDTAEIQEAVHFYVMLLKIQNRRENFDVNRVVREVYPNVNIKKYPKTTNIHFGMENP